MGDRVINCFNADALRGDATAVSMIGAPVCAVCAVGAAVTCCCRARYASMALPKAAVAKALPPVRSRAVVAVTVAAAAAVPGGAEGVKSRPTAGMELRATWVLRPPGAAPTPDGGGTARSAPSTGAKAGMGATGERRPDVRQEKAGDGDTDGDGDGVRSKGKVARPAGEGPRLDPPDGRATKGRAGRDRAAVVVDVGAGESATWSLRFSTVSWWCAYNRRSLTWLSARHSDCASRTWTDSRRTKREAER
jgi:hypothetical protein